MQRAHWLSFASLLALAGALLACDTLTRLGALPQPTATATAAATTAPASDGTSLHIEAGPIIGSPRETRVAVAEQVSLLEHLAQERYDAAALAEVGRTFTYTVTLDEEQDLLWAYGWCATTQALLEQNLEDMTLDFSVNGTVVDIRQFEILGDSPNGGACLYFAAVVYAWPQGATRLEVKVTYEARINDGTSDYAPGSQTFVYIVNRP